MDTAIILSFLQESLFMIVVFGCFLFYTIAKGRQSITNLILGLYFGLLISIEFPYYNLLLGGTNNAQTEAGVMIVIFVVFAFISTLLFSRILPREYDEKKFEGFGSKLLLATAGTVLVMAFSFHALPVTDFITPGSPINFLFGSEQSFFWWMIAPIVILFVV